MIGPDELATLAWKVQPELSPWAGLKALLIGFGAVAFAHVAAHAIHFPLRTAVGRWLEERRERRRPQLYLRSTWRSGDSTRLRDFLVQRRPRGLRG